MEVTYFVNNLETIAYLVQRLTQTNAIVCCIHECEPEESMLEFPLSWCTFFNPMSGDSEVSIRVGRLPCIVGKAYLPTDHPALIKVSNTVEEE